MADLTLNEKYVKWFDSLCDWQKDLFNELLTNGLNKEDTAVWFSGYIHNTKTLNRERPTTNLGQRKNDPLRKISCIKNIKNVGAINNEEGYDFQKGKNIALIFGNNGCGKSTLINLFRNLSGARGRRRVRCNVFEPKEQPGATIHYETSAKKQFDWVDGSVCLDLEGLQFFDSDYYEIFQNSEAEILIEHNLLVTLGHMVEVYGEFEKLCDNEISALKRNTKVPSDYKGSEVYAEFDKTGSVKEISEFCKNIVWNERFESELQNIDEILSESDPQTKIDETTSAIEALEAVFTKMHPLFDTHSDKNRAKLIELKQEYARASELVKKVEEEFSGSALSGTGGGVWKELWNSAKEYSKLAYPNVQYPNTDGDSRCVLCQQTLSKEAKQRFVSFQEYVMSDTENKLSKSFEDLSDAIPPEIMDWSQIENTLLKGKVPEDIMSRLHVFHSSLLKRSEELRDVSDLDKETLLPPQKFFDNYIAKSISALEAGNDGYRMSLQDRERLDKQKLELSARKWLHENRNVMEDRMMISELGEFDTQTNKLSRFKTAMSEELITQRFIDQFKKELISIGASKIRVEIKAETLKGVTSHKIVLRGLADTNVKFSEILSEGERRAISFAAFVAELAVNFPEMPLIFDDPTNSMDSYYEERIAKRIVELSKERQVIVFTHRLTMVTYLSSIMEGQHIHFIKLRRDPVGANDPNLIFITGKVRDNLSNLIKKTKELKKKPFEFTHQEEAVLILQIRKLLESIIENVILDEIVKRNQLGVSAMKLKRLKAIEDDDIDFFDGMMTRYSAPLHKQSIEVPELEFSVDEMYEDLVEIEKRVKDCNIRKDRIREVAKPKFSYEQSF